MLSEQTRTYLLYSRGLMPDDLTIGSLHLDPANPIDNENKFFHHATPVDANWLRKPQIDKPCSVSADASREWHVEAGLSGLLQGGIGSTHSGEVTVSGKVGRRLQLKDPETFLNNVILTSKPARRWLESKLTLLDSMVIASRLRRAVSGPPKIWMVTGLQYIEGATISSAANTARSSAGHFKILVPDPSLVAAMSDIPAVQGGMSSVASEGATSDYSHADERVWAAQFRPLKVKYLLPAEVADQSNDTNTTWIKLHGPENLRRHGIRTEEDEEGENNMGASLAQVVGMDDIETGDGQVVASRTVLDTMLKVDWVLLDDLLEDQSS